MGHAQVIVGDPGKQPEFQSVGLKQLAMTKEGQDLIASGKAFVLENTVWQGFGGAAYTVRPWQLSEDELEVMLDVDGTKGFVLKQMAQAKSALAARNRRETLDKENRESAAEFQALQLRDLREKMGVKAPPLVVVEPELGPSLMEQASANPLAERVEEVAGAVASLTDLVERMLDRPPAADPTDTDDEGHGPEFDAQINNDPAPPKPGTVCLDCSKKSPPRHPNPERWLQGHRRGAHHKS